MASPRVNSQLPVLLEASQTRLAALQSSMVGEDPKHTATTSISGTPSQVILHAIYANLYCNEQDSCYGRDD